MLIIALSVAVALAAFAAFIVMCLGIRREDRAAFRRSAPTFAARQARRFTGLRTQPPNQARRESEDRVKADA